MGKMGKSRNTLAKAAEMQSDPDDDSAWHPESLRWITLKKNEARFALYLGFTDLGEFRKYLASGRNHP